MLRRRNTNRSSSGHDRRDADDDRPFHLVMQNERLCDHDAAEQHDPGLRTGKDHQREYHSETGVPRGHR